MKIIFHPLQRNISMMIEYLESIVDKDPSKYSICMNGAVDKNCINIFLRDAHPRVFKQMPLENIYLLNTEQLSRLNKTNYIKQKNKANKSCIILNLNKYKNVIDYSEENLYLMPKHITSFFLPYQVNFKEIYNYKKTKNVVTLSIKFDKRINMLNRIKNMNINICEIKAYGIKRDLELFKYKILVNIHVFHDYTITEQMRINRCIFNKMIIISENGYQHDDIYLKDYIIFCDYDDIPKKVEEVLNNYEYYYNKIYGDFDINKIDAYYTQKLNDFEEEITNNYQKHHL